MISGRHSLIYHNFFQTVEVFSAIGGFIGCWLGISLMDIADITENFVRIAGYFFVKRKLVRGQSLKISIEVFTEKCGKRNEVEEKLLKENFLVRKTLNQISMGCEKRGCFKTLFLMTRNKTGFYLPFGRPAKKLRT